MAPILGYLTAVSEGNHEHTASMGLPIADLIRNGVLFEAVVSIRYWNLWRNLA